MEAAQPQNMSQMQLHATVYLLEFARVVYVLPLVIANQPNSHLIHLQEKYSPRRHVQRTSPLLCLQVFPRMSRLTAVVRSARKLFGIHLLVMTTSVAVTLVEEEYRTLSLRMEVTLMRHADECLMNFWTVLAVLYAIQNYATVHLSLLEDQHRFQLVSRLPNLHMHRLPSLRGSQQ